MPSPQPPAAFDAILFDLDGTLADSAADIRHALDRAFAELGIQPAAALDALVDGSPLEEIYAVAVPGGTPQQLARFVDAYRRHYEADIVRATQLFPGVRETLEVLFALRPRMRLAVATTKRERTARALVSSLGITEMFEVIAGSGGTDMPPKPAPDLFLAVARMLEVAPSRTLVVGDTLRDLRAGARAGMRTAAVTYGMGSPDTLIAAQPDYVLEEFDELLVVLGMRA
jgi:phosphoglycolate phosphatase